MTNEPDVSMHNEHRVWEADISCWRDDIANWQHELADALSQLQQLEKELQLHESQLRQHASSIRLDDLEIATHEHALASSECSGDKSDLPVYAAQHMKEKLAMSTSGRVTTSSNNSIMRSSPVGTEC